MKDIYLKPVNKTGLVKAFTTIGADEAGIILRIKENPKAKPIKAIFNKKQFRYKRPPLQWDQKYQKLNL